MPSHNHLYSNAKYLNAQSGQANYAFGTMGSTTDLISESTRSTGGSQAHNNLQPYVVSNFIIKAKQTHAILSEVINSLSSDSEDDALSAKMGKALNTQISNLKSYSTEETLTGEIWIDGKPIYRKTLQISNSGGTTSSVDLSSLNISNIFFDFSKSFYYWKAGNRILPLTSTNIEATSTASTTVSQNQTGIFYYPTDKRLYLEFGYNRKITSGIVTIEYTKTTD